MKQAVETSKNRVERIVRFCRDQRIEDKSPLSEKKAKGKTNLE